jgi:hypothetical protein
MTDLHLDDLDRDGALLEAFDGLHGRTRADLLRGAVLGSVAPHGGRGAGGRRGAREPA